MKPYSPHPYQLNAIQMMVSNASAAMLLDPGLGKTSISLAAFTVLRDVKAVRAMLVIAPLRPARITWPAEVAKWAEFAGLRVSLVLGTLKARLAALATPADVYIVNPENTAWLAGAWQHFAVAPDMLVVDESTRYKNPMSVRFKALKPLLAKFSRRYILTGTPTPQSITDLFAQSFILDEGRALGRFITAFRRDFCVPENVYIGGGRTVIKWHAKDDAPERVYKRLNGRVMRLKAEDYLNMPKLTHNVIEVDLPLDARRLYDSVAEDLFGMLKGGAVLTAANAAAAIMKLRQIVNGWAYGETGSGAIHDAKLDALADLVEEQSGTPLLVAVSFLHEVDAIRKRLGDERIPYLGGGVSAAEADRIVAAWNRGELPVLLAHPTSVAHGLNLQAGGHCVCWFGLTWALEEHEQLNARVYRQGQERPVIINYIIARGTVDNTILDALRGKKSAQSALLDALQQRAPNRDEE